MPQPIIAPRSEPEGGRRSVHRARVLAALHGAARRGWLGPAGAREVTAATGVGPDRVGEVDLLALSIKAALERIAVPLGRATRALAEARGWSTFGYARIGDYARERLGRTGRWLRDQAALGRALERWPGLAEAMRGTDGGRPLGRVSALLVGKVASEQSVRAWIELARSISVRELKEIVRSALHMGSDSPPVEVGSSPAGGAASESATAEHLGTEEQDELDERCRVRMALPQPVLAAFDEALGLHRAVSGQETSATSFVEALVAEAHAGPRPPDVDSVPCAPCRGAAAVVEKRLAKRTDLWARLRDRHEAESAAGPAADALARFEKISHCAGRGDAAELDRQIRELIALEDELERRLGRLLRELSEHDAWRRLSFAGLCHYAEQRLGLGRTAAEGRARLARALQRYPALRQAYEEGRVGLESALIVVRILNATRPDRALERAWVARAEEATVKRLRDEARALGRRQGLAGRIEPAAPLDDAAWHGSLLQRPGDIRARVRELARRALVSPSSDVFLRLSLPDELAGSFLAAVESWRQGLLDDTASVRVSAERECDGEGSVSLEVARTFSGRGLPMPAWVGLLAMLEDFVETWDAVESMPARRSGEVYAREGWRCLAPGCTSRRNLEDHHLHYRSRGGDVKALSNRICLCEFHHRRGEHGGLAQCRGTAPLGVLWRLGRRDVGVWFRNERRWNVGGPFVA